MIFEKEDMIFQILDVVSLSETKIDILNKKRNYCALSFRFSADTEIIINNEKHYVKNNSISFFPNKVDYKRISDHDNLIAIHFNILNFVTDEFECFTTEKAEVFKELFEKILDCWNEKEDGYKYRCSAILNRIFEECYKENHKDSFVDAKIQKSVNYLLQNYKNSDLTIKKIADKSFVSEVYFRKLFKESYGISPQKYIVKLRIKNAVSLMNTGFYSLKEIASISGFNDYKHFVMAFKKENGVSPSKYLYKFD